jgi:hypothetical protein
MPHTSNRIRETKKRFELDVFSPPIVLGGTYLLLFGVGIADVELFDSRTRLRSTILYFGGLSTSSLLYLILTYVFFLVGYYLSPAGAIARHIRPGPREWLPNRASVVTTIFFLVTFGILVLYTVTVGYGRFEGSGNETLANLSLLGELSLIPLGFSLVRYGRVRAGQPGAQMSRWDRFFLWGVMLPAQVLLSVIVGMRTRALVVALMPVATYHYTCRRLAMRTFAVIGAVLVFVVVPVLGELRPHPDSIILPEESASYSVRAWESVAGRTSAVETYTIIYENRERVPEPDPIHWALLTGLVPRFLWPTKPQYTFNERLTLWAVGGRGLDWMGPTLPGELIMLLGYVGTLAFMALLGGIWRFLREVCLAEHGGVWLALYIVIIRALLTVEVGFILPYATLTRYLIVTALLVLATTARVRQPATQMRPAAAPGTWRRAAGL